MPRSGQTLRSRRRNASFWTTFAFGSNIILRLISNLILTRLLSPEVFGLMALAQVVISGLKKFSDTGTKASVIRSERGDDEDFLRTAWTIQVLRGVLITTVACLLAWPVSRLYDENLLFPLILVLSVTPIFAGFSSISSATVNRKLILKTKVLLTLSTQIFSMIVTILAAWWFGSVWALAIGGVLGSCFNMILGHIVLPPFRHRFRLEPAAAREIFSFGRWILLGTLFMYLGGRGRLMIQGLFLPIEIIGLISIASLIAWAPGKLVGQLLGDVVFPAFSEIRRKRPQDLQRALGKVRLVMFLGVFPVFFVVTYFAQPLIDLLYDDRYAMAGPILALMSLNGALGVLSMPYQNLLLAEGRSRLHATFTFLRAGLTIAGLLLGFFAFGFVGMFVGIAFGIILTFLAVVVVAWRSGYATWALDFLALGLVLGFYAYTLSTLDLSSLSTVAAGRISL